MENIGWMDLYFILCNLVNHPRIGKPAKFEPRYFGFPATSRLDYQMNFANIDAG